MAPFSFASLSLFFLLVVLFPASHGASFHESYKLGSRKVIFKKTPSSGRSQQASTAVPSTATCSSLATGLGNNKLPVVHPLSPCSPLKGLGSLTAADVVLRRDASLIRRRFSSQSSMMAAPGPSPAATIIPANGSWDHTTVPSTLYRVLVSYGTPEQQFPVELDTSGLGVSLLRCKPCASGSDDCQLAFDMSRSSTFANILCGSPDCPTNNCSSGSFCPLDHISSNGTFVEDVLTLAPSMAVNNFRFFCMDADEPFVHLPRDAGSISLTMDRNSLPSQLSSASGIAPPTTFSYCLPLAPSSVGFLSLGGADATVKDNNVTAHAPLVINGDPELASMYFIDLVGMSLGDEDLPIPAETFSKNVYNLLDVGVTFAYLVPDAYTPLRDSFQKQMLQYKNLSSPGFAGFDTCYNFTGLNELTMPLVQLNFSNGDSLIIQRDQMLYYDDPGAAPFTMACLAFSSLNADSTYSAVIGTYTLASTEVVYDVAGGKVGFIPGSC